MTNLIHRRRARVIGLVGALVVIALPARAQRPTATVPVVSDAALDTARVAAKCTRAVQAVRAGPSDPGFMDGLDYVKGCGARGANAAAAALRGFAALSDTVALDSLSWALLGWRDAGLFREGVTTASSPAATPESRVFAIRYLHSIAVANAGVMPYGAFTQRTTRQCQPPAPSEGEFVEGRPLPANFTARLVALGRRLASDASVPEPVRLAAGCLLLVPKS